MKIINVDRQLGKTEYLINRHIETGYPIIVPDLTSKRLVEERICIKLDQRPPLESGRVMTLANLISGTGPIGCKIPKKILIDDADRVLDILFSSRISIEIDTIVMSIECKNEKLVYETN